VKQEGLGTIDDGFLPGGPYFVFPMLAGSLQLGASVGTMVALVTGRLLLGFYRMPVEIGVLDWKLWLIRLPCTFFFAPNAELIANKLFAGVILN